MEQNKFRVQNYFPNSEWTKSLSFDSQAHKNYSRNKTVKNADSMLKWSHLHK